jgi:ATP-dependent Lon protease
MESVLGCPIKTTATEQKNAFHSIIKNAINDSEKSSKIFTEIQESLSQIAEDNAAYADSSEEPVVLTNESVQDILKESGLSEDITTKIETAYAESFGDTPPVVDYLIDKKVLAENEKRKVEKALIEQVQILKEKLEETTKVANTSSYHDDMDNQTEEGLNSENNMSTNYDVVLQVKPEKMNQIKSQIIDGKKCIIIPLDENEHANVNGVKDFMFSTQEEVR